MKYSRLVWATALEAANAICEDGQCDWLRVTPKMLTAESKLVDTIGELTVVNTGPAVVVGEEIAVAQDISGFWVRVSTGDRQEVTAELNSVLKYTDISGVATLKAIRSDHSNLGSSMPLTVECEVTFKNPWKLDGLCGSKAILQYIGKRCETACTLPIETPAWEVVLIENRRARWIKFNFKADAPSDITIDSFWDGEDPEACGQSIDVEYPLGQPCVDSDVVACYDPKGYKYKVVSSESAMLGPASTLNIIQSIAFAGCGINYTRQSVKVFPCGSEPSLLTTSPTLVSVDVLKSVVLLQPIAACENVCRYEWNGSAWVQTQTCGSGSGCNCASRTLDPPTGADPTTLEFPCDRDDGATPRSGSLNFQSTSINVCSYVDASGVYSIPLTECPTNSGGGY